MSDITIDQLIFALTSSEVASINENEIVLLLELAEKIDQSSTKFFYQLQFCLRRN